MKLLVVEDSQAAIMATRSILNKFGFDVDVICDGYDGADVAIHNHYDLILMDLGLPTLSGIEATRKIRAHKITTPIVALTATSNEHSQEHLDNYGFNGSYQKPLTFKLLADIVATYHLIPQDHQRELLLELPTLESADSMSKTKGSPDGMLVELRVLFTKNLLPQKQLLINMYQAQDWQAMEAELLPLYGGLLYIGAPRLCLAVNWLYQTLHLTTEMDPAVDTFYDILLAEIDQYITAYAKLDTKYPS